MPDPITPEAGNGQAEEMVSVTINGKEISVPKSAQAAAREIKDMEASLQRGATEKFEAAARKEKAMLEDVAWYKAHPDPRTWEHYAPKVQGGQGQLVADAELERYARSGHEADGDELPVRPQSRPAFTEDPQIKAMRDELAAIKAMEEARTVESVKANADTFLGNPKYDNANRGEVMSRIGLYFQNTGQHPTRQIIEEIVKKSHAEQTEWLTKRGFTKATPQNAPTRPNMPSPRPGAQVEDGGRKRPRLDDVEAWGTLVEERTSE